MKYEVITVDRPMGTFTCVNIVYDDGSMTTFPADEKNPNYQAYLAYLAEQEEK